MKTWVCSACQTPNPLSSYICKGEGCGKKIHATPKPWPALTYFAAISETPEAVWELASGEVLYHFWQERGTFEGPDLPQRFVRWLLGEDEQQEIVSQLGLFPTTGPVP